MQRARSFVAADIQGLIDTPRCNSPRSRGSSSPRGPEADAFYAADKELSLFNSKALRRHVISVYNHLTGAVKTSQRAARIVVPVALICLVLLVAQHLVPGTQVSLNTFTPSTAGNCTHAQLNSQTNALHALPPCRQMRRSTLCS